MVVFECVLTESATPLISSPHCCTTACDPHHIVASPQDDGAVRPHYQEENDLALVSPIVCNVLAKPCRPEYTSNET